MDYTCIVVLVQDSCLQYGQCPRPGMWPSWRPAGWLLSEQSLAPLLGETWWPSKCLLGLLLLLQGCSHPKLWDASNYPTMTPSPPEHLQLWYQKSDGTALAVLQTNHDRGIYRNTVNAWSNRLILYNIYCHHKSLTICQTVQYAQVWVELDILGNTFKLLL